MDDWGWGRRSTSICLSIFITLQDIKSGQNTVGQNL